MAVSASVQSCGVNEQVTDVFDPACPGEAGAGLNGRSEPGMGVRAEFAHAESANASAATTIFLRITAGTTVLARVFRGIALGSQVRSIAKRW
jgi:hypothetical protein